MLSTYFGSFGQSVSGDNATRRRLPGGWFLKPSIGDELQKKQGFTMNVWLGNNATIGEGAFSDFSPPGKIGLEYPVGSGIEHLFGAGLWIGTIVDTARSGSPRRVPVVTTGYDWGAQGPRHEMFGNQTPSDTFYSTSIFASNVPNKHFVDDDGDGRVDEDELDGIDNDNDGRIDEDYGAISESDISVSYTDDFSEPVIIGHIPLGLKIWQKSYAWGSRLKDPILPFEFYVINTGTRTLDSVYIGFFSDCWVGPYSVGNSYLHKYSGYLPDVRTAYADNVVDQPSTPYGITLLGTPKPLDSLHYTFQWNRFQDNSGTDAAHYQLMSSGIIKPDESITPGADTQFLLSFGPFDAVRPRDTLKVAIAIVSGASIDEGFNTLKENATKALLFYGHGYTTPEIPPSPPLRLTPANNAVTLEWKWRPGDPKFDPLETWDDSNKFVSALPDTHWRRRNPPPGHSLGGRIFEGFRIWRSESPSYDPKGFTLLKQVDIADDLGFEFQTGLQYAYVDSGLVRGKRYWYAVTSFSIPGASIIILPDPLGGPAHSDTLVTEGGESSYDENAKLVQLPFLPSKIVGEVKVVPNPYRTDRDYTYAGGGWEGLGRDWNENKRVIWFIHLPPKATIHIFSIGGDIVSVIDHNDAVRTTPDLPVGQEEWNLLSSSGRAIASGVYIFTVESDFGTQIGKFVVIR
jgi:hypothetical protein